MSGKADFILKKTSNDEFMFNLRAANHEIIATSQRYSTKDSALNGIESVKNNAADAEIIDETDRTS